MASKKILLSEEEYQILKSAAASASSFQNLAPCKNVLNTSVTDSDSALPAQPKSSEEAVPPALTEAQPQQQHQQHQDPNSRCCEGERNSSAAADTPIQGAFPGKLRAVALRIIQNLKQAPSDCLTWDSQTKRVSLLGKVCEPELSTTDLVKAIAYPHITRIPEKLALALAHINFPKELVDNPNLLHTIESLELRHRKNGGQ